MPTTGGGVTEPETQVPTTGGGVTEPETQEPTTGGGVTEPETGEPTTGGGATEPETQAALGITPENCRLAATAILNSPDYVFLTTAEDTKGEPDFHRPHAWPVAMLS